MKFAFVFAIRILIKAEWVLLGLQKVFPSLEITKWVLLPLISTQLHQQLDDNQQHKRDRGRDKDAQKR